MAKKKKPLHEWHVPIRVEVNCEISVEAHSAEEAASIALESWDFDDGNMMAFDVINLDQRGEPKDCGEV